MGRRRAEPGGADGLALMFLVENGHTRICFVFTSCVTVIYILEII